MRSLLFGPHWAFVFRKPDDEKGSETDDKDEKDDKSKDEKHEEEIEEWRTATNSLVAELKAVTDRLAAVEGRPDHATELQALRDEAKSLKSELEALKKQKPKPDNKKPSTPTEQAPPRKSGEDAPPDQGKSREPRRKLERL